MAPAKTKIDDQPTKTAVIEHDVHAAIAFRATVEDGATIQEFINSTLRENEVVQRYQKAVAERDRLLAKHESLTRREAEMQALDHVE